MNGRMHISSKKYHDLAETSDVPSIKKISPDQIQKFNSLLVWINQHSDLNLDRAKVAQAMSSSVSDLNKSLQVTAPSNLNNNLVAKSIRYLESIKSRLDK